MVSGVSLIKLSSGQFDHGAIIAQQTHVVADPPPTFEQLAVPLACRAAAVCLLPVLLQYQPVHCAQMSILCHLVTIYLVTMLFG